MIIEELGRDAAGSARCGPATPAAVIQHACLLSGHCTRIVEQLGVPVPECPRLLNDPAVVPLTISEAPIALMSEPPVEFDAEVVLVVVDVDPHHPCTGPPALALARRETVRPLDSAQVLELEC